VNTPFPSVPPPDVNSAKNASLANFLNSLGHVGRHRPAPNLSHALIGIGGALLPIGLALLFNGDSASTSGVYIAALLCFGLALAARLKPFLPTDLMSATAPAGVVSLVLFFVVLIGDTEMDIGLGLLIAGIAHIALWFAPGFRGSSLFLGAGTFVIILALADIFTGSNDYYDDEVLSDLPVDVGSYISRAGIAYLIFGVIVIGAVFALDRAGYKAVGTALVPPGMVAVVLGIFLTVQDMDNAGAGVLFFLVGLALCVTGERGERRAMTWWGAAVTGIGVVAFFAFAIKPETGASTGITVLVATALLVAGPRLVATIRKLNAENSTSASQ